MAAMDIAEDENGNQFYYNPSMYRWEPLVDKETTRTGSNGDKYIWADGAWKTITGSLSDIDAGVRDWELSRRGLENQMGIRSNEELAQDFARRGAEIAGQGRTPEYYAAEKAAGGTFLGEAGQLLSNPIDYALPKFLRSLAPSVAAVAPALVPGLGTAGRFAAGAVGSLGVGEPARYTNEQAMALQAAGIDPQTNPQGAAQVIGQNQDQATRRAIIGSVTQAPFDAAAAVLGARTGTGPMTTGNILTGLGQQAGLGMAGEGASQIALDGGITDGAALAEEGVLELFGAPGEFITQGLLNPRRNRPLTPEDEQNATATNDSIEQAAAQVEANPDSLTDFLTPDDLNRVVQVANANGIPMSTIESWTPVDYTRYALRLKAIESRRGAEANLTDEVMQRNNQQTPRTVGEIAVPPTAQQRPIAGYLPSPDSVALREKQAEIVATRGKKPTQPNLRERARQFAVERATQDIENRELEFGLKTPAAEKKALIERRATELEPVVLDNLKKLPDFVVSSPRAAGTKGPDGKFSKAQPSVVDSGLSQEQYTKDIEGDTANRVNAPENAGVVPQAKAIAAQTQPVQQATQQMQQEAVAKADEDAWNQSQLDKKVQAAVSQQMAQEQARRVQTGQQPLAGGALKARERTLTQQAILASKTPKKFSKVLDTMEASTNVVDINSKLSRARDNRTQQEANQFVREQAKVADATLKGVIAKLGLTGKVDPVITLQKLADNAGGYVEGKTIVIAALQPDGRSLFSTINHEVIHALKNLGLFTDKEWVTLNRDADLWADELGLTENSDYATLTQEELREEAIAEHFAQRALAKLNSERVEPSPDDSILSRISQFFGTLRNWLKRMSLSAPADVEAIFDAIESGVIGKRNPKEVALMSGRKKYSFFTDSAKKTSPYSKSVQDAILRKAPDTWPILGEFFSDLTTAAGRFKQLRPYRNAVNAIRQEEHAIRQKVIDGTKFLTEDFDDKQRKELTVAAGILDANNEKVDWPADGVKSWTIELKEDQPDFGKAGTKITLGTKGIAGLKALDRMYKDLGKQWIQAININLIKSLKNKNGNSFLGFDPNDVSPQFIRETTKSNYQAGTIDQATYETAMGAVDIIESEMQKISEGFYIPHVRTSPYFMPIYDRSQVDEKDPSGYVRIGTVSMPTNISGGQASVKAQAKFAQEIENHYRKTYPNAFVGKQVKVDVGKDWSLTEKELSSFEKLALLNEWGTDEKVVKKILESVREEFGKKGFEKNWQRRKNVPGYIHPLNNTNYLVGASLIYGDRAARGIALAKNGARVSEELATLENKVRENSVGERVYNIAKDHYNYITNPENQEGEVSSKLRAIVFHAFLGFNPASAMLNLFQSYHTSVPVLIGMFGNSGEAFTAITKNLKKSTKFLNTDFGSANVFNEKATGVSAEIKDLVAELTANGTLQLIQSEELQARRGFGGVVGANAGNVFNQKGVEWLQKIANWSASLFSRTEAMNRIATAITAYEFAKKASKTPAGRAKLMKFLEGTAYADIDINDPRAVATAAVELSQFDTTKYNRAKAFRGAAALPTQFLSFPVRMIQLYIDLLRNAVGTTDVNGTYRFTLKDSTSKAAFTTMLLGLWATSGLVGAVPLGAPAKDLYDKIYQMLTGVDPDIGRKFQEQMVDLTGSKLIGESMMNGFMSKMLGADIQSRVGIGLFGGINTDFSLLDVIGPTGGLAQTFIDAGGRWNQGHEWLAAMAFMPAIARNITKAYYENEYGIVTARGNITPSNYSGIDAVVQSLGFTPIKLRETRDLQYAGQRLVATSSVAKERFTQQMVTARTQAILAAQRGDPRGSREAAKQFQQLRTELIEFNKSAAPEERINVGRMTTNVMNRVKQNIAATQGRLNTRRVPKDMRRAVAGLSDTLPEGYTEDDQ